MKKKYRDEVQADTYSQSHTVTHAQTGEDKTMKNKEYNIFTKMSHFPYIK